MCVCRQCWIASDGKKRVVLPSSTPDLEKSHFFCALVNIHVMPFNRDKALTRKFDEQTPHQETAPLCRGALC